MIAQDSTGSKMTINAIIGALLAFAAVVLVTAVILASLQTAPSWARAAAQTVLTTAGMVAVLGVFLFNRIGVDAVLRWRKAWRHAVAVVDDSPESNGIPSQRGGASDCRCLRTDREVADLIGGGDQEPHIGSQPATPSTSNDGTLADLTVAVHTAVGDLDRGHAIAEIITTWLDAEVLAQHIVTNLATRPHPNGWEPGPPAERWSGASNA